MNIKLKLLMKTARSISIEIADGGKYFTIKEYDVLINGEFYKKTKTVVTSLFELKPETEYTITVRESGGGQAEEIVITTDYEFVTLDVVEFGAKGDGKQDDTVYLQAAIMACPEMGRVLIPKGTYKISSLFLKDHIRIELAKGAKLLADHNRWNYPILPGMIESYDETQEYNLGSWEGNPLPMFSGIITGIHVTDVILYGEGSINGNASFDNWWHNEKVMKGAYRPRMLFLNKCENISVQGLCFHDSPAWVIHPYFSSNLHFCGLTIKNPHNSPNTDGLDPESCHDVKIEGVHFSLGDDCIAIKSGKIYMGKTYKTPSSHIHIRQCLMENGHGAVTIGSEMAGGVNNVVVEECFFKNTDRGLRIKTRRGRGRDAVIDQVVFRDIKMDHVMTPFVINCFYFCDPDGKSEYVQSRNVYPVDEKTPIIKKLLFQKITCDNCHVAAAFFEGLPEMKIEEIVMEEILVNYASNAKRDVPAMSQGVEACCKKGIYARNIRKMVFCQIGISGQDGDDMELYDVDEIITE